MQADYSTSYQVTHTARMYRVVFPYAYNLINFKILTRTPIKNTISQIIGAISFIFPRQTYELRARNEKHLYKIVYEYMHMPVNL